LLESLQFNPVALNLIDPTRQKHEQMKSVSMGPQAGKHYLHCVFICGAAAGTAAEDRSGAKTFFMIFIFMPLVI